MNREMVLYHFTILKPDAPRGGFMRRKDSSPIWAPGETQTDYEGARWPAPEGLTPEPGTGWGSCKILGGPEVVWLTSDPRTVPAPGSTIFRVKIKIPAGDRRLINWPRWRNKHAPDWPAGPAMRRLTRAWWGYAGTIPLDWVAEIDIGEDQIMPWIDTMSGNGTVIYPEYFAMLRLAELKRLAA